MESAKQASLNPSAVRTRFAHLVPGASSRRSLMIGVGLILTLFFFAFAFAPANIHSAPLQQAAAVEDLWIDLRIGPPLIALFNEAAREDDIARVDHPSQAEQLSQITNGRKMVIFKSIDEAKQLVPDMADKIDIVGYNLEHNPATPPDEQADPLDSIQQMRALADEHGLQLAFGPDHDFALSHGVEIAPYVDYFVLQIQRQQTNPETVKAFVEPLVPQLREANPDLEISVQVRTEGDVDEIVQLLDDLKEYLDGVSILTSPDTVDVAWELVAALRPYVQVPSQGGDYWIYIPVAAGLAGAGVVYFLYLRKSTTNQHSNNQ